MGQCVLRNGEQLHLDVERQSLREGELQQVSRHAEWHRRYGQSACTCGAFLLALRQRQLCRGGTASADDENLGRETHSRDRGICSKYLQRLAPDFRRLDV